MFMGHTIKEKNNKMDQKKFIEQLQKLVDFAGTQKKKLEVSAINDYFKGIDLSINQVEYIYQYLEEKNIKVIQGKESQVEFDENFEELDDKEDLLFLEDEDFPIEDINIEDLNNLAGVSIDDPVKLYLKEIGIIPLLSSEESLQREKQMEMKLQNNV